MTRGDAAVETAAQKLESFVANARSGDGLKAKVGAAMSDDPEFLRKLKPSLIKARARGASPTDGHPGNPRRAPAGPQLARPRPPGAGRSDGPSPWLVLGAALAGGYLLAKIIDWRGHAHPNR